MQNKKDILIDKIVKKDYNNELEKILENKDFDEDVKNLLLGILYKLDISYKDYQKVKKTVETKEEYIENILKIVQNECEKIRIVKINSEEANELNGRTFLVDKDKKEIMCYPIERKLLYSIEKIEKSSNIIHDEYFLINETLANTINIGNSINNVEVLRDFNGWSWSTIKTEIESIEHNLIYQNLQILLGEYFLSKWVRNREYIIDYYDLFKSKLQKKYGLTNQKKFLRIIQELSILLEMKVNPDFIDKIKNIKYGLEENLKEFNNKEQYIEKIMNETKEIKQKIKQIDEIRNDKNLLKQEYDKRNEKLPMEKKIFSMRILSEILRKERENLYEELEKKSKLLNPKIFVKEKSKIEEKLNLCSIIDEIDIKYKEKEIIQNMIRERLISFQKIFLNCFSEKIEKSETKNQIIDLIYELRYYYLIPFDINNDIYEIDEISKKLKEITKQLISKAIEFKIILRMSEEEKYNYEIISNILKIRTIDIETLNIQIKKEKEDMNLYIYDANSCEYKTKLGKLDKEKLEIKLGKKIKLFI